MPLEASHASPTTLTVSLYNIFPVSYSKSFVNDSFKMSALAVGAAVGALASEAAKRFSSSSSNLQGSDKNVGILAIDVYTPSTFISQSELEDFSGVSKGKYTLGLGQEGLGFCGDAEDVNSLALTVVHSLLEK